MNEPIINGVRYLPGVASLLVVAPHGPFIRGRYKNDVRTGIIVEEIHHRTGCTAIINDLFFKPKGPIRKSTTNYILDLYRIDHARKVPGYLEAIEKAVARRGKTLVIWVHGLSDEFAAAQARFHRHKKVFAKPVDQLDALIAFGQGGDPKRGDPGDRFTARWQTVEAFKNRLTTRGMTTLLTHPEAKNYRGRDAKRLNQWFNQQGYGLEQVESIQLEIRVGGFRNSKEAAVHTGRLIAAALADISPANN